MAAYTPAVAGGFDAARPVFIWCYEYVYVPAPNRLDCHPVEAEDEATYSYFWDTYCAPGYCFTTDEEAVLPAPSGFASSGSASSPGGSVTLQPFEFTTEQQTEVYTALAVVFGVFLAAMALVWGYKQILKVLSVGAPGGD